MPEKVDATTPKPEVGVTGRKIIYNKDGTPCRSCNSLLDFQHAMGKAPKTPAVKPKETETASSSPAKELPPDVIQLGRSSWTLLHSVAATYPEEPTTTQQSDLKQFMKLFGNFYPCWFCADDFKAYMNKKEVDTSSQEGFGRWLCDAHNEVNVKLGKPKFDCNLWKQRWKDGWDEEK